MRDSVPSCLPVPSRWCPAIVEQPARRRGLGAFRRAAAAAARRLRRDRADAPARRRATARTSSVWLERVRAPRPHARRSACTPTGRARATRGRPAAIRQRASAARRRGCASAASSRRFFCGGGWYTDDAVRAACRGARARRLHAARRNAVARRAADDALARPARARRPSTAATATCTRTSTTTTCSTRGAERRSTRHSPCWAGAVRPETRSRSRWVRTRRTISTSAVAASNAVKKSHGTR